MNTKHVSKELPVYSKIFNKEFSELDINFLTDVVNSILYESQINNTENVNSFLEREIKKNFANSFLLQYLINKKGEDELYKLMVKSCKEQIDNFYPRVLIKGGKNQEKYSLCGRISLGPEKKDFEYLINNPSCFFNMLNKDYHNHKVDDKLNNKIIVMHEPSFDEKQKIISFKKDYVNPSFITYIYKIKDKHMLCFKPEKSDGKTNFVRL